MELNGIKPASGAKHAKRRVGRGIGSGLGKTAGRGHKGQKSRAGGYHKVGFEGGQMPLFRRMPKRGFNNAEFRTNYAVVNIGSLDASFEDGATVNEASLLEASLIRKPYDGVKVLGTGELKKKLNITVNKASASAKAAIEKAGGTLTIQ